MNDSMAESDHTTGQAGLPRGFGTWTGLFIVVASMVGVGILTTPGYTIKATQNHTVLLSLWTLGGVLALCGALTLAELATTLPQVGGEYVFVRTGFGPATAFLYGWATLLVGFAGPTALISHSAVTYLTKPFRDDWPGLFGEWFTVSAASAIIAVFTVIHCLGHKQSSWVQDWSTALKLVFLFALAFLILALGAGDWGHFASSASIMAQSPGSLAISLIYVMYSYSGWNGAVYLAGEIRDPKRIPRCLIGGCLLVTALYLLLNVAYAFALDPVEISSRPDADIESVAELSARVSLGSKTSAPLSVFIGLGVLSSVGAYVLTGPRVSYAMARDGLFPRFAGIASARTLAPVAATIAQGVVSISLLFGSQFLAGGTKAFNRLLDYTGVGLVALSGLTVACIFPIRGMAGLSRPFKVPLYPLPPLLFLGMTAWMIAYSFREESFIPSLLSLASILAAYPVYWLLYAD